MSGPALHFAETSPVYAARADGRAPELFGPVPSSDDELVAWARERAPDAARRGALVEALAESWRAMELPAATVKNIEKLRDPATRIVIAGQQPALAGGPLFLFAKVLSVVRLAERVSDLGVPAVPVFWIADEDHDVGELESGVIPGRGAAFANPFSRGRLPVRDARLVDDGKPAARLGTVLREEIAARLVRTLDPAPGVWFRKLLLDLCGETGIVPVTPDQLRALRAPLIARELQSPGALAADVARANEALRRASLPVTIENAAEPPVFFHESDGDRHRLEVKDDGFLSRGPGRDALSLLTAARLLEESPERFSPDALLRPLIQDELFEPFAVISGPTEMAYQLQLVHAYERIGVRRPLLMPRLRVRVLDGSVATRLEDAGIDATELGPKTRVSDVVPAARAVELKRDIEAAGESLSRTLELLESEGDHALAKRAARLRRRWLKDRERLLEAIDRGAAVDEMESRRRAVVASALEELYPGGADAERTVSAMHFFSRYGLELLDDIGTAYDPYDARPRLLTAAPKSETSGVTHG